MLIHRDVTTTTAAALQCHQGSSSSSIQCHLPSKQLTGFQGHVTLGMLLQTSPPLANTMQGLFIFFTGYYSTNIQRPKEVSCCISYWWGCSFLEVLGCNTPVCICALRLMKTSTTHKEQFISVKK